MISANPYDRIISDLNGAKAGKANGHANGHAADGGTRDKPDVPPLSALTLTPSQWVTRAIEPEDSLLGAPFSTTSRGMFAAETGKGKTMVCIAIAFAIRLGLGFLHWKGSGK